MEEELSEVPVLSLHPVVVETIHKVLREIEDTHTHTHESAVKPSALVDLDHCQVIIEDVSSCERWAAYQMAQLVFLQIDPSSEVLHGFPNTELFMSL